MTLLAWRYSHASLCLLFSPFDFHFSYLPHSFCFPASGSGKCEAEPPTHVRHHWQTAFPRAAGQVKKIRSNLPQSKTVRTLNSNYLLEVKFISVSLWQLNCNQTLISFFFLQLIPATVTSPFNSANLNATVPQPEHQLLLVS